MRPIRHFALLFALLACGVCISRGSGNPATNPATHPATAVGDIQLLPLKDLALRDVDGVERHPLDCGEAKAAVVFFLATDCPISNGYSPEINRICSEYGGAKKIQFSVIHPEAQLTAADARKHAQEYHYAMPVCVDGDQVLAKRLQAKVTPEVAVIGPDGGVLYRGRIDDTWTAFGRARIKPTTRDLRDALDAILAGKQVPVAGTDAIGCPI